MQKASVGCWNAMKWGVLTADRDFDNAETREVLATLKGVCAISPMRDYRRYPNATHRRRSAMSFRRSLDRANEAFWLARHSARF